MKLWRVDEGPRPIEVECSDGWPSKDADGYRIYEYSHFGTEAAAWEYLLRDREAGQSLAVITVTHAEAELARAKALLCDVAKARSEAEEAYKTTGPGAPR